MSKTCVKPCYGFAILYRGKGVVLKIFSKIPVTFCHWLSEIYKKWGGFMLALSNNSNLFFFSIWVFFHEHSRITGLQGKVEGICLTPHYHFHPLHRHLDISRAITPESSPLHIASTRPDSNREPLISECKSLIITIYHDHNDRKRRQNDAKNAAIIVLS